MNVDEALDRLRYEGPREPNFETLRSLQHAFLESVPFENIDIHIGRSISLDPSQIYEKIVLRRRGGFCYECNGLFAELLASLGYTVSRVSARMARAGGAKPPLASAYTGPARALLESFGGCLSAPSAWAGVLAWLSAGR